MTVRFARHAWASPRSLWERGLRRSIVAGSLLLAACSSDNAAPTPASAGDGGTAGSCPEGFAPAEDGVCAVILPPQECPEGTAPIVGAAACTALGTKEVPEGFAAQGWGFSPVLPVQPCQGATRDALGRSACEPIGDCDAAFPPAAAIVVDPRATPDATHKRTLSEALAATRAGGTIAIESGTHVVAADLALADVSLVGRCAKDVVLQPSKLGALGFRLNKRVTLRGITFTGFDVPLTAGRNADVTAEDMVLRDNIASSFWAEGQNQVVLRRVRIEGTQEPPGGGIKTIGLAALSGANVTVEDSLFVDNTDLAIGASGAGTALTVVGSVVRDMRVRKDKVGGSWVAVFDAAQVSVDRSAFLRARGQGFTVSIEKGGAPSVALRRSFLGEHREDERFGSGDVLAVTKDAELSVAGCTIAKSSADAVIVDGESAKLDLSDTVIRDLTVPKGVGGMGLIAIRGGNASVKSVAMVRTDYGGVFADRGARIDADLLLVQDPAGGPGRNPKGDTDGGQGIAAIRAGVFKGVRVSLVRPHELGVFVASDQSEISLELALLRAPSFSASGLYGYGAVAAEGGLGRLLKSVVEGGPDIGVAASASTFEVRQSRIRSNRVGLHAQKGVLLKETDAAPAPLTLSVSSDTRLEGNQSRIGQGEVPIPSLDSKL